VKHERTSQPIDRILVAHVDLPSQPLEDYREEYTETSVQGFDKRKRELERAVDKIFELPLELWELTGVVLEARASGGEKAEGILRRVRSVLGNVFLNCLCSFISCSSNPRLVFKRLASFQSVTASKSRPRLSRRYPGGQWLPQPSSLHPRFPDVVWELTGEGGVEEVWGHKGA
jgi:hypothetical protein